MINTILNKKKREGEGMKKVVLGMLLLGTAAMGEVRNLSLEETIELAYKNSYVLENADIDLENSQLQVKEAYKEALPKVDYNGSYKKNQEEIYGGNDSRDNSYSQSVSLVQPLYRGGIIGAGVKGANLFEELSNYTYDNEKKGLRLDIIDQYTNILELEESLEVFKTSLGEVEGALKRAKRQYELKLIARSEVLPFQTKVINTKTSIIKTENEIEIAKVKLKNELKIPSEVKIELEKIDQNRYDVMLIDIESDVDYARENNTQYNISRINSEIAQVKEAETKSEFLPKVDLVGGYGTEAGNFSDANSDWEWNVGVNVSMNLFSFGQDLDAYKRSKNETKKQANLESQSKDNIEVEVRSNYLELIRLRGTIAEQEVAVESAEENYNLEKRRYESGLTDVIDFLAIESSLREAELSLIQSELDYYLAYERYKDSLR